MLRGTLLVVIILVSFLLWKLLYDASLVKQEAEISVDMLAINKIIQHSSDTKANLARLGDECF